MSLNQDYNINDDNENHKRLKLIAILLIVIFAILMIVAIKSIKPKGNTIVIDGDKTIEIPMVDGLEGVHIAKSSWANGAWCKIDKKTVSNIYIVPEYNHEGIDAWFIDDVPVYQVKNDSPSSSNKEQLYDLYIEVDNGIIMTGNMHKAFADFINARTIQGLEYLYTENVTDLSSLFEKSAFEKIDIHMWNTKNVTNASRLIFGTEYLTEIIMTGMDFSNVLDMSRMFSGANAIEDIYFENVDTSHVLNMFEFFRDSGRNASENGCTFHGVLDTSKVENMRGMFMQARLYNLQEIISSMDTSSATDMTSMFDYAVSMWGELDLSNWDVSNVKHMDYMFRDANLLKYINTDGWNPASLETAEEMFLECHNLREFSHWKAAPNLKNVRKMFSKCFELTSLDFTFADGVVFEDSYRLFWGSQSLTHIYSNGFTPSEPYILGEKDDMFEYCISIEGPTPYSEEKIGMEMATTEGYLTPTKQ